MPRAQTAVKRGRTSSSAKQRRAGARRRQPPRQAPGKAGSRGGGPVDRQVAERDEAETRERRERKGDSLGQGRADLAEPTRESTRGPEPRGGDEGKRARARRAGLGFRDDE